MRLRHPRPGAAPWPGVRSECQRGDPHVVSPLPGPDRLHQHIGDQADPVWRVARRGRLWPAILAHGALDLLGLMAYT